MNLKKSTLTLLCALSLLPLAAWESGTAAPVADTAYVFRFVGGNDMFYMPYKGNDKELQRLQACVEQHKAAILAGETPLHVDGHCNSAAMETENLAIAKLRSNRVKSELITRNHSGKGDYVTVRLVVPLSDKTETDTAVIEDEGNEQAHLEAERRTEAERFAAEKQAEQQRMANGQHVLCQDRGCGPSRNVQNNRCRRKHGGDICHYLLDESHRECDGVLSRNWGSQPCQPEQQSGVCAKSHRKERFLQ